MTIASETISLRPLPVKKPRNENHADFNAVLKFLRSWISSPTNAPKNGPRRMPIMFPVNTPSITPTIAPLDPAFDPPDFFVKKPGTKLFSTSTMTVSTPNIINAGIATFVHLTKYPSMRAPQHKGVPGIPGTMQPIIPTIIMITPTTIKAISFT